jgi:pimeloyl-ACP methyl ester carboxylesterase
MTRKAGRCRTVLTLTVIALIGGGLSVAGGPGRVAAAADPAGAHCADVTVPVTVSGQSGPIAGTLCTPAGATTVQLLIPGYTYGRYYWALPHQPEIYSYPRHANAAGYATLAMDRIGIGGSWHPPSPLITYDSNVDTIHQVVQALRRGTLGTAFRKVVLAGHSYGAVAAYVEAATYHDVDALLITAGGHRFNPVNIVLLIDTKLVPATSDPKFANSGYDPGYETTMPGARSVFYSAADADPAVIALDEQLKQTGTGVEAASGGAYPLRTADRSLSIPSLTINGDLDPFFCDHAEDCSSSEALAAFEQQFYAPGAVVKAQVMHGAGHALNLELVAPKVHASMLDFVNGYVGH